MTCRICGKEVPPDDQMYPDFHYKCSENFYRELEALKVIVVLSIKGTQIMFKLNDFFQKELDKALDDAHTHII